MNIDQNKIQNHQKIKAKHCEAFGISQLLDKEDILYITYNEAQMKRTAEILPFFIDKEIDIINFPAWDCMPYDRISPNHSVVNERISALADIINSNKQKIVLTTVNSALQRIPGKNFISSFYLKKGERINRDELIDYLIKNGYTRLGKVMEAGEFSIRGSIIDIFPPDSELAYRFDFFDEEIEDIRTFDTLSQVSEGKVNELTLLPTSEIILNDETVSRFSRKYRELFGIAKKDDLLYESIASGNKYQGMEHWLPLFYDELFSIFDYLKNAKIILGSFVPAAKEERLKTIDEYYQARTMPIEGSGIYNPLPPDMLYLMEDEWQEETNGIIEFI